MRYPLFGTAQKGKSLTVTAQRRLNLYGEISIAEDKSSIAFYPTPGLNLLTFLSGPARGFWVAQGRWFAVADANLYEISSTGTLTIRGMLGTSEGNVDMSDDGLSLIIVDGDGYSLNLATNVFATIGGAFPGANTVVFDSGRVLVNKPDTGQFWWSDSYDVNTWNALNFATAESSPDNLVRVFADQGQVILFGSSTTEFWAGQSDTNLAYAPIGSSTVEWGLVARWSVTKFNRSIVALMGNLLGQQQIVTLSGYTPVPISTPDVDYQISQYSTVEDAIGFSYNLAGHPMYEINFPTAGKTWLYDGLTNLWSELESDGGRHWANHGITYNKKTYVSDYVNGNIYQLTADSLTDNGTNIAREIVGRHVFAEGYQPIAAIWVEMQPGVGNATGEGQNPVCGLSISRDGGFTYGDTRFASMGKIGEYKDRVRWRKCGRARDFVYKFRVTDPVYPVFVGAYVDTAA